MQLSQTMHGYIQQRVDAGRREDDAIQVLIDRGDTVADIAQVSWNALLRMRPNFISIARFFFSLL